MVATDIIRHAFTGRIESILQKHFGKEYTEIFSASPLLAYLNLKTRSANRGSKARGAFANHYALYVLVEDYVAKGFAPAGANSGKYEEYEGARFSELFRRQRELPFGQKLQNHALNARLNDEFQKFFPTLDKPPIVRDLARQRYWVQEDLLNVKIRGTDGEIHQFNIASSVLEIIDEYVAQKLEAFEGFIDACRSMAKLGSTDLSVVEAFVRSQLQPNVDARIFEIVSFAILKAFYGDHSIFWGWTREELAEESLTLFKTGRTNANDGGIDFVMRPLGRFFQVTETVDVHKYFLDIDKIQRYPLTFVVKSDDAAEDIRRAIRGQAAAKYRIKAVVDSYLGAVEEIINIPTLVERLNAVIAAGRVSDVMNEIAVQSKVEFNYEIADEEGESEETVEAGEE